MMIGDYSLYKAMRRHALRKGKVKPLRSEETDFPQIHTLETFLRRYTLLKYCYPARSYNEPYSVLLNRDFRILYYERYVDLLNGMYFILEKNDKFYAGASYYSSRLNVLDPEDFDPIETEYTFLIEINGDFFKKLKLYGLLKPFLRSVGNIDHYINFHNIQEVVA